MSQKTSRKGVVNEEKDKTDTPVKEMKKKMAANAEKEKAAAEKSESQPEKVAEKAKATEKQEKNVKQPDKTENTKTPEKSKEEKKAEKNDKAEKDKKIEKPAEKKTEQEKPKDDGKGDKHKKQKQNGHNGTETNGDAELNGNGTDAELNGRVSAESSDELDVHEDDELFPELTYDDSEDSFEPPTPDGPSRSYTRRSQSKESKVLKLNQDSLATDRKLRSADSPKPETKKHNDATDKKDVGKDKEDEKEKAGDGESEKKDKMDVEVVDVEVEADSRKLDTNFSKSRVKVSPYRRSMRLADQTTSSVMANYTGNNTTMEMDITETSSFITEDPSLDDSYLSGLRSIRGRRSYKRLSELSLRSVRAAAEQPARPTAPVVGRKRRPAAEAEAGEGDGREGEGEGREDAHKRPRLLERIAQPFRRSVGNGGNQRRAAEIVGLNTDLPLSAPLWVADPEALKPGADVTPPLVPHPPAPAHGDSKRCTIM
nr:neurofilament heavy polypeptide-like isoform X2 [Plodia interpunctella]